MLGTVEVESRKNLLRERKLLRGTKGDLESGLPANPTSQGCLLSKVMRGGGFKVGQNYNQDCKYGCLDNIDPMGNPTGYEVGQDW